MKVGDSIGGLFEKVIDGKKSWYLAESKITRIVQNSRGTKVYSKHFYPLDIEEIEDNTEVMLNEKGFINTRDVVELTPDIRYKCERWVEWANKNPERTSIW